MTTIVRRKALWLALVIVGAAASVSAEPMFLAKQLHPLHSVSLFTYRRRIADAVRAIAVV